jgi:hypothetical protein
MGRHTPSHTPNFGLFSPFLGEGGKGDGEMGKKNLSENITKWRGYNAMDAVYEKHP